MVRIGVVTTSFPRWPGDPAGAFVAGHVRALRRLGHEVEVIAAGDAPYQVDLRERERRLRERRERDDDAHELDLREGQRRAGSRRDHDIIRVPAHGLFYGGGAPDMLERAPLRGLLAAASFVPRFVATVATRARRWDQVIAHWLAPSALAAAVTGRPLTAIAHGGDVFTLRRMGLLRPALRGLSAAGARLVFVSEELRALAGVDGDVQPMGIDIAHFAGLGRAPATPPVILVVARLVPIKGIDVAIEAAARLRTGARLVIAGDGPERRALEARAYANARRGATPVTFLGEVTTSRRDELLRMASVVVVSSRALANGRTEGCPTIALEALAAGVPVVATIGRATTRVPADDPDATARAIETAIDHGPTPDAARALVADLDWSRVAARLVRSS